MRLTWNKLRKVEFARRVREREKRIKKVQPDLALTLMTARRIEENRID